jgi:hypothetical protein
MPTLIQLDLVSQDAHRSCKPDFQAAKGDYVVETEIRVVAHPPSLIDVIEVNGEQWIVVDVFPYGQRFHIVTCTQDGQYPLYRKGWEHSEPVYLCLYTNSEQEPTSAEGYESTITSHLHYLPKIGDASEDGIVVRVETIAPSFGRLPWGYNLIALCQVDCQTAIATNAA